MDLADWQEPAIIKGLEIPPEKLRIYQERAKQPRPPRPPSPWIAFLKRLQIGDAFEAGYFDISTVRTHAKAIGIKILTASPPRSAVVNNGPRYGLAGGVGGNGSIG